MLIRTLKITKVNIDLFQFGICGIDQMGKNLALRMGSFFTEPGLIVGVRLAD